MNTLNTRTEHFGVFSGVFRRDPPSALLPKERTFYREALAAEDAQGNCR